MNLCVSPAQRAIVDSWIRWMPSMMYGSTRRASRIGAELTETILRTNLRSIENFEMHNGACVANAVSGTGNWVGANTSQRRVVVHQAL